MKRCPQCQFIYPDTDEVCDFDQTTLALVADSDIDSSAKVIDGPALAELAKAHANAIAKLRSRKGLPIAAATGLTFGLVFFSVYYRLSHPAVTTPVQNVVSVPSPTVPEATPVTEVSPNPELVPSPEPSPTDSPRTTLQPSRISTAHSSGSAGPVSTGVSTQKTAGGKPVILLASGGRIEADEVWQTKDGVWYRANGMVTLLKRNRVRGVVRK